jgi:hypothetical protein
MMFSFKTCHFVLFSLLSLSANAETVRGSQRELLHDDNDAVRLGKADKYVILTKTGISTVPTSAITGDIAVSPIAATAITGFGLSAHSTNKFSTTPQVVGQVFAADYAVPIPTRLTDAIGAMEAAYTDAKGRHTSSGNEYDSPAFSLGVQDGVLAVLGSTANEMTSGVYTFKEVTIGADIYFTGSATDIFIIQISGNLMQVDGTNVHLLGEAKAENIFWQVAGKVEVGTGSHMEGILLAKNQILFKTGSSLKGRAFSQTSCDLQVATITEP